MAIVIKRENSINKSSNKWKEKFEFNNPKTPLKISESSKTKLYSEKLKSKYLSKIN